MSRHVHIDALGRMTSGTAIITLAIGGPRGGMRAIEDISIDEAEKLVTQLQAAVADARAGAAIDPVERFMQDVIDRLRDPGLALDPSFRSWCASNHGLLSPRQSAERWCCWHVA
ncbi:hypothetical protein [Sphingobium sp. YR768]|uniref:hypothetical protein n=1 Tax=Sphingobium sp. YR768 TaxID=1884365 RepID=UPI0008C48F2C|nr:hypothetical protein [Sphingobium sp. YR768]SER15169.1 hypothetical protein SAMN05518866_105210 [Sphingobium sp. YR768]